MKSLQNKGFVYSQKYNKQQMRARKEGAHPAIIEFERKFIKAAAEYGIPLFCSEMWRSQERQNQLYKDGYSKAKGGGSPHQYGLACDIIHSTRGWDLEPKEWEMLNALGREVARKMNVKIYSGIRWSFYDPAHWQLENWRDLCTEDGEILY